MRLVSLFLTLIILFMPVHAVHDKRRPSKRADNALLYSLLKQKFEDKPTQRSLWPGIGRHVAAIGLAIGCGVVGAALLDHAIVQASGDYIPFFRWLLERFGSAVEKAQGKKQDAQAPEGIGISVEAGIRFRTPKEFKDMAENAMDSAASLLHEEVLPLTPQKTMFKPLFCIIAVGSYVLCRYLLQEESTPFYDRLNIFVADWEMHRKKTPQEFHHLFDRLHGMYNKHGDLDISEQTAMSLVRQISMVCTSRMVEELGITDVEQVNQQRDMLIAEKELTLIGWQLLPTICNLLARFFC